MNIQHVKQITITIIVLNLFACGSAISVTSGSSGSDSNTSGETVAVSGTIGSSTNNLRYQSTTCSNITKVIATDTDGNTVVDDSLDSCAWQLSLTVGKSYAINFVNASNQFVASLITDAGNILKFRSGVTQINLGNIAVNSNRATTATEILCYLDTDDDGSSDCEDDTPCAGNSCDDYYSCAHFGYSDSDDDGICDRWEEGDFGEVDDDDSDDGGDSSDDTNYPTSVAFAARQEIYAGFGLTGNVQRQIDLQYDGTQFLGVFMRVADSRHLHLLKSDDDFETVTQVQIQQSDNKDCFNSLDSFVDETGAFHVVWSCGEYDGGNNFIGFAIHYAKSTNGGTSFSSPVQVSSNTCGNWNPTVAASSDGQKITIAWECEKSIYVAESGNAGSSFTNQELYQSSYYISNPELAYDSADEVFLAAYANVASWYGNIYALRKPSGGSWSSAFQLNGYENQVYSVNWDHDLIFNLDDDLVVSWPDERLYNPQSSDDAEMYVGVLDTSNNSYLSTSRITEGLKYNHYSDLSLGLNDQVNMCFKQSAFANGSATEQGVMFTRSYDGGHSWIDPANVNSAGGLENMSQCAVASNADGKTVVLYLAGSSPNKLYVVVEE